MPIQRPVLRRGAQVLWRLEPDIRDSQHPGVLNIYPALADSLPTEYPIDTALVP